MRKNNTTITHGELSKIKGTVAQVIADNMPEISAAANDNNVDVSTFRTLVVNIISTAKKTAGRAKAIGIITKSTTKFDIAAYATNAVLMGDNHGVIR
jgi:hypothetical protein